MAGSYLQIDRHLFAAQERERVPAAECSRCGRCTLRAGLVIFESFSHFCFDATRSKCTPASKRLKQNKQS
jgi:hypothetical protein